MPGTKRRRLYGGTGRYRRKRQYTRNRRISLRRRLRFKRRVPKLSRGKYFLPKNAYCKFRFSCYYLVNEISPSQIYRYTWRGNSIYDPDQTGTGAQPMGHDQMAAIYDKYSVIGSSFKAQFINNASQSTELFVAPGNDIGFTNTNICTMMENGATKHVSIPAKTSGSGKATIRTYQTTRSITGVRPSEDTNEAAFGANPTNAWYWNLELNSTPWSPVSTALTPQGILWVTIVYYCKLTERKEVTGS